MCVVLFMVFTYTLDGNSTWSGVINSTSTTIMPGDNLPLNIEFDSSKGGVTKISSSPVMTLSQVMMPSVLSQRVVLNNICVQFSSVMINNTFSCKGTLYKHSMY